VIRLVGLDLDGTLIDSTDAIVASFLHAFETLGWPAPDRARIIETISVPLAHQFQRLVDRDPTQAVELYREHYAREATARTRLLPGVTEGLHRLSDAGLATALATSKSRTAAEMLMSDLGVRDYLRFCLGPEDVAHPKPHPEQIALLCERAGIPAADAVYVGDSPLDVQAAKSAGVRAWCVTSGYSERETLQAQDPEAIFDDFTEVVNTVLNEADTVS